jgi:hypothetical protein
MMLGSFRGSPAARRRRCHRQRGTERKKKADEVEHPQAFNLVGLLFNEPPGTAELLFI